MLTANELAEAEAFFHAQIPLTRAMGLRVVADAENGFAIEAPVALNYNHLRTAFGGSINAIATLAGYGFLWLELRGAAAHVVVAESSIRFLHPVRETIRAVCVLPAPEELSEFRARLTAKGTAGICLRVQVIEGGVMAAELTGHFVAKDEGRPVVTG